MSEKKFPSPQDIQKEFEDFVRSRFGGSVQVVTQQFDRGGPMPEMEEDEPEVVVEPNSSELYFDYKPREVKEYLDRFVIKQDEAKRALAIAVCDHYNHVRRCRESEDYDPTIEYSKQNVLLLGPTGVGKTYLVKQIARLIGVPFVKADATRFSETGYVGANADDLIRELVNQADGNLELAQYGIVYLDEADKLASQQSQGMRDVAGRGVQFSFLKLMEETEVDLRSGHDMASQMQAFMDFQKKGKVDKQVINTKHILFIVSGAFHGLDEIIKTRLQSYQIGFQTSHESEEKNSALFAQATTADFVNFGFEPEFVGRLPVRVACHELGAKDLYSVLKDSEGSIIRQYQDSFDSYGIYIKFLEKAMRAISELAVKEKPGARGLMTVCERILRPFKFELPSTDIDEFRVTEKTVLNPQAEIKRMLKQAQPLVSSKAVREVKEFCEEFKKEHGMEISFTNRSIKSMAMYARKQGKTIKEYCSERFRSYEHGLKLIHKNTGRTKFPISDDAVLYPDRYLEDWIRDSYSNKKSSEEDSDSDDSSLH